MYLCIYLFIIFFFYSTCGFSFYIMECSKMFSCVCVLEGVAMSAKALKNFPKEMEL